MRVFRATAVWVLLAGLSLAGVGRADVAADARGEVADASPPASGLRLSGIVTVAGEPRLAVIEGAGGDGLLVRVDETLPDGSRVLALGPDWVRLAVRGQETLLRLEGLPADAQRAPPDRQAVQPGEAPRPGSEKPVALRVVPNGAEDARRRGVLTADGELGELIAGAAAKRRSTEALGDVIGAHLGLPMDAEVTVTDLNFAPFADAADAKKALDENSMLRVKVTSGEEQQMLYLRSAADGQAAGAPGPAASSARPSPAAQSRP